jgi:hypothetical protein
MCEERLQLAQLDLQIRTNLVNRVYQHQRTLLMSEAEVCAGVGCSLEYGDDHLSHTSR